MIEQTKSGKALLDLTFEQLQMSFVDERHEDWLYCASLTYLMSRSEADSCYKAAAIAFMYEAAKAIYGGRIAKPALRRGVRFAARLVPIIR